MKAKLDDTTTFGCSHHNHSKHRVSVNGLTFDEASVLEGKINDLLDGKFEREAPLDNRTREEVMSEGIDGGYPTYSDNISESKFNDILKECINDILLSMQIGERCIGQAANDLLDLKTWRNPEDVNFHGVSNYLQAKAKRTKSKESVDFKGGQAALKHRSEPIAFGNTRKPDLDTLRELFNAGLNRGVFVASVLTGRTIDGDYPTFEEFIEAKRKIAEEEIAENKRIRDILTSD